MFRLIPGTILWMCAVCVLAVCVLAQLQGLPDGPKPKDQSQQQNIPDAPQPKPQQFPENAPPAPRNAHPEEPAATPTPAPQPVNQPGVTTDRNQLPVFSISVNFVQIPVTVKDRSGRLVAGLNSNDFRVYED